MDRIRVAIVHNILTPYTVPLFNELASRDSLDILVYSMAESEGNRHWSVGKEIKFPHTVLSGIHPNMVTKDTYTIHINPGIVGGIADNKPDIVISSGYASVTSQLAFLASRLMRIPFVLWWGTTANEISPFRRTVEPYLKWLFSRTNGFIAYGSSAKEYLVSLGAPPQRVFIAYNTVDVDFFTRVMLQDDFAANCDRLKETLGIDADMTLLYVGQLIERKGLGTLFEAIRRLQNDMDIATIVVGTGSEAGKFARQASTLRKVCFAGNVDYDSLPYYYGLGDLLVLPSVSEVWGLVVNEAMACGLPVIASKTAGCSADLIKEGVNGYTFEPHDSRSLADKIRLVAVDRDRMKEFGRRSREVVMSGFTIRHCADQIEEAIMKLAEPSDHTESMTKNRNPEAR